MQVLSEGFGVVFFLNTPRFKFREKAVAPHSSTLAWITPWMEEPGTLQSINSGFPGGSDRKESACNAGDPGSVPASERSPGGGNGDTHSSVLAGESHGQRSLVGYSPRGHKRVGHD